MTDWVFALKQVPVMLSLIETLNPNDTVSLISTCKALRSLTCVRDVLTHLEVVKVNFSIDRAALRNNIHALEWLHAHGYRGTAGAVHVAAQNGQVHALEWLHARWYRGTEGAVVLAAQNGHVPALEWLYAHGYRVTEWAVDRAAQNGHVHALEWFYAHGYRGTSEPGVRKRKINK